MICPVIPVGDGIIVSLPADDVTILTGYSAISIDVDVFGFFVTFEAKGGVYNLPISYQAGAYLAETEGNVYIYSSNVESGLAMYGRCIQVDQKSLTKAVGAWEALYGHAHEITDPSEEEVVIL